MALDLCLAVLRRRPPAAEVLVAVDPILGLPRALGILTRHFKRLEDELYDDPFIPPEAVAELADEARRIRDALIASKSTPTARGRHATRPAHAARERPATRLDPATDPQVQILDQLLALCQSAIDAGVGIEGISD